MMVTASPSGGAGLAPRARPLLRGTYRVLGTIDRGGMGVVLRAEHVRLNRPVAIKILPASLAKDTACVTRFRREIENLARLEHPHIVQILDCDVTEGGKPFLVLELLHGENLAARLLRDRRLPLLDVSALVRQLGGALAATHAAGIVHRDVKPANVFLVENPGEALFAKLIDFGVSVSADSSRTTGQRVLIGTPDYMAPEQALGRSRDVTHRTDQYSLATIAWEALAGELPFRASSSADLLARIVSAELPSLTAAAPWVPRAVEVVLRRALHKEPERRYPSVEEFAAALASALAPRVHPPAGSGGRLIANSLLPEGLAVLIDYLGAAEQSFTRGNVELAAELSDLALDLDSSLALEASRTVVRLATPLLERIYSERLRELGTHIERSSPRTTSELTPRQAFILSLVDASGSIEDILDSSSLPTVEGLRLIGQLAWLGEVRRAGAGAEARSQTTRRLPRP